MVGGPYNAGNGSESSASEQVTSTITAYEAAIFGHELGNSLAVISCSLQSVEKALEIKHFDDPRVRQGVRGALGEVERLEALLDEFRSNEGFQTFELVDADLGTVVEEVLALQTLACQNHGITVQFECENDLPWVRLNPAKLTQVILNLCRNALEAMPQGGCMTIKVYQSSASVTLEIGDNGIGLPRYVESFDGLVTTKRGGRGIGLMIVRQIVAAHDAEITFSSEAGQGTTFKVDFPIK